MGVEKQELNIKLLWLSPSREPLPAQRAYPVKKRVEGEHWVMSIYRRGGGSGTNPRVDCEGVWAASETETTRAVRNDCHVGCVLCWSS